METPILDVTVIEPKLKHSTIFEKFDALFEGESLIINNDHDPKPVYYQLLAERGQVFNWEYLQSGPVVWQVKIDKNHLNKQEDTIGEIVAKDYRKALVFKNLGIDFCCGGKRTLTEACNKKGLEIEDVKAQLAAIELTQNDTRQNFKDWAAGFLSDYIVNTHHKYVKDNIPFLTELSAKVAKVHGNEHPELINVAEVFAKIAHELNTHMFKEERILFPYIKQLEQAQQGHEPLPEAAFGNVSNPIMMMEMEHTIAGEDLSEIRSLTHDYELPADACTSYKILYQKLEEFENDLHNHVHLENNILFLKALKLEQQLTK